MTIATNNSDEISSSTIKSLFTKEEQKQLEYKRAEELHNSPVCLNKSEWNYRDKIRHSEKIRKLMLDLAYGVREIENKQFARGEIKIDFGHGLILPILWINRMECFPIEGDKNDDSDKQL